jgi:hypothetical protein
MEKTPFYFDSRMHSVVRGRGVGERERDRGREGEKRKQRELINRDVYLRASAILCHEGKTTNSPIEASAASKKSIV